MKRLHSSINQSKSGESGATCSGHKDCKPGMCNFLFYRSESGQWQSLIFCDILLSKLWHISFFEAGAEKIELHQYNFIMNLIHFRTLLSSFGIP